jgi:hypothetical protein
VRTAAEKSAGRAAAYRRAIAGHLDAGRGKDGLAEALRWLRSEAAHAARVRPGDACALHDRLTAQVATLAAALADPAGTGMAPRSARRAGRHRRAIAGQLAAAARLDAGRDTAGLAEALRAALAEAVLWLQAEAAGSPGAYGELAARIAGLAAEIPGFRSPRSARRHHP